MYVGFLVCIGKHFSGADPAKVKQVHSALLEFVLEAAKSDLDPEDLTSNLEEANVSDSVSSVLVPAFREHKVRAAFGVGIATAG